MLLFIFTVFFCTYYFYLHFWKAWDVLQVQDLLQPISCYPRSMWQGHTWLQYDVSEGCDLLTYSRATRERYWEALYWETEFLIHKLRSLNIFRSCTSLADLQEQVMIYKEATNLAHNEFEKSAEALQCYCQRSIDTTFKIDKLIARIRKLWRDFMSIISWKLDLQTEQDRQARAVERK